MYYWMIVVCMGALSEENCNSYTSVEAYPTLELCLTEGGKILATKPEGVDTYMSCVTLGGQPT